MLLEHREIQREIDYRDYPKFTYRQKRALLQSFSYWLIKNSWTSVDLVDADDYVESRLPAMSLGTQVVTPANVRRLFVERTGMLREPILGRIEFTHRTFQEFLAAQAALDDRDIGVLISKADDDQWRELIVLAAGLA